MRQIKIDFQYPEDGFWDKNSLEGNLDIQGEC